MRIIFAGTPHFALPTLQALIDSPHEIIAVYTQPDRPAGRHRKLMASPVKTLALAHNLKVLQPKSLKNSTARDAFIALKADLMVVVAYGLLLPTSILTAPTRGCINVHASLLPRWRGAAPIQRAILEGDVETGITIMQMAEGLDTGPILKQIRCPICLHDTSASLHETLAHLGASALMDTLEHIDHLNPLPQDEHKATYANKLTKEQAKISWEKSAIELSRQIRAFDPWPIAFCEFNSRHLRIWQANPLTHESNQTPGTIIKANKEGIDVATGKGTLRIMKLQMPNAKAISAIDFVNAHPNLIGVQLI